MRKTGTWRSNAWPRLLANPDRVVANGEGRRSGCWDHHPALRVDRIFDEAGHAGDPVQLMRVFGLGVGAAVRYVSAAYPEKFRREPASP